MSGRVGGTIEQMNMMGTPFDNEADTLGAVAPSRSPRPRPRRRARWSARRRVTRPTLRASPAIARTSGNLSASDCAERGPPSAILPDMACGSWRARRLTVIAALAVLGVTVSVALAQDSVIVGTDGNDVVTGTPVDDSLYGRAGNDALLGLAGDDELDGGPGADGISGGAGADDSVSYTGAPVNVTLDGQANDGAAGEGDNVLPDVEDIYGTDGPDVLVGSAAANTIDGNAGDDRITGGPGADSLIGGDGDDTIDSRDGSADSVDCGPGHDSVFYDANDILRDCEALGRTPVTENFQLNRPPAGAARVRSLRLANIARGSKITVACISRCRPRSPRTRAVAHRRSVTSSGPARAVSVRIKRSPLVAGATFEIGVKAPRSKARCRRWVIVGRSGRIGGVRALSTHCRSVARDG
jgi:hypothetical protein